MGRPKKLIVQKLMSDNDVAQLEGKWIDESYLKYPVIRENIDVYYHNEQTNSLQLILKFRKNCIPNSLVRTGWDSYKDLAKASRGRGASAGPINPDSVYWKKRNLIKTKKWSTSYLTPKGNLLRNELLTLSTNDLHEKASQYNLDINKDNEDIILEIIQKENGFSKMKVNNQVASNPIGFYEKSSNFKKYNEGLPFIQKIDSLFQSLIPDSYQKQLTRANEKETFKIPKTAFSTITINRNFRTALHRDAGDFKGGFGNLTVIERGKYHGAYTILPQFGVAVDVRTNDFLAMDVHQWHSNTPMYETKEDKKYNDSLKPAFKDNPEVGTEGIYEKYTRLTFVCYLREKLNNCDELNIDPRFLTSSGHSKII